MQLRRAGAHDCDALTALQHAAYAENERLLGATPIPLQADYADVLREKEVWLVLIDARLVGALILDFRPDDMLIWSVAADPRLQGAGVGDFLLHHAQLRAREEKRATIRLYTASVYEKNIAWYTRHGFAIESREALPDRIIVHMKKHLD